MQKVSKSLKIALKVLDLRWLNVQNYFRRILALWRCMGLVQADIPDWHYQTHIIILACRARVTILWSHKSSKYVDSRESSSTLLVAFKKVCGHYPKKIWGMSELAKQECNQIDVVTVKSRLLEVGQEELEYELSPDGESYSLKFIKKN